MGGRSWSGFENGWEAADRSTGWRAAGIDDGTAAVDELAACSSGDTCWRGQGSLTGADLCSSASFGCESGCESAGWRVDALSCPAGHSLLTENVYSNGAGSHAACTIASGGYGHRPLFTGRASALRVQTPVRRPPWPKTWRETPARLVVIRLLPHRLGEEHRPVFWLHLCCSCLMARPLGVRLAVMFRCVAPACKRQTGSRAKAQRTSH